MARETSERFPSYPLAGFGGFSFVVYGLTLIVIALALAGFFKPESMRFFCGGRGIFVLPGLIGILILVSELSHRHEIRILKEQLHRLEKDKKAKKEKSI